jgi:DNA polymerase-3 subunit gamma/tau
MLSTSAFNALLKTLEEPPEYVVFILATTEIHKVPITILSRCQRFDLARVPVETLKKHFLSIAGKEKVELSDIAADLIARAADGSVRDGLSILDQAIAQTGGKVDDESVMTMLRRADRQMVTDLMRIILAGDADAALRKSDEVYQAGSDVSLVLNDMLEWTHWATRGKIAPMSMQNAPYTPDQKQQMKEIADGATLNTMSRIWQVMVAAGAEIKAAGNPKQNFDMLLIRMINISDLPPVSQILETRDKKQETRQETGDKRQETSNAATEPRTTNHESRISSANDLSDALSADKELTLLADWSGNCEIIDFADGKIKIHYSGTTAGFVAGLSAYLRKKTGAQWDIDLAESENKMTVGETRNAEIRGDPLVADALNLFGDATVMSVS